MDDAAILLVDTGDGGLEKRLPELQGLDSRQRFLVVRDAAAALEILAQREVSVVVADFGAQAEARNAFCREAAAQRPAAIRIALLPTLGDLTDSIQAGGIHYGLCGACRTADLLDVIVRSRTVWRRIRNEPALAMILSSVDVIPTPPAMYFDIRDALRRESTSLATVVELVQRDSALAAKTLKVANSGFYGLPRAIADLETAIGLLGTDLVLALALTSHLLECLPLPGVQLDKLWVHGVAVSSLARYIAREEGGDRETTNASGVAGLLHDIGGLLLLSSFPAEYQRILRRAAGDENRLLELEHETFGIGHPELGGLLLSLWNLPDSVVQAVEQHHSASPPDRDEHGLAVFAVATAELVLHDMQAAGGDFARRVESAAVADGRAGSDWHAQGSRWLAQVADRA